jgi:hypothetical protein
MLDSKSLKTYFLEIMISSKNEQVCIHDLNHLTLLIILAAWWASINVGSKHSVPSNISRLVPSWRFHVHYRFEETSSGETFCIVSDQVRHHPSDHGTSSGGKLVLAKAQIAKLNALSKSEGAKVTKSTVDEAALAILKRHGSSRIALVSLQRKFIFIIQV